MPRKKTAKKKKEEVPEAVMTISPEPEADKAEDTARGDIDGTVEDAAKEATFLEDTDPLSKVEEPEAKHLEMPDFSKLSTQTQREYAVKMVMAQGYDKKTAQTIVKTETERLKAASLEHLPEAIASKIPARKNVKMKRVLSLVTQSGVQYGVWRENFVKGEEYDVPPHIAKWLLASGRIAR